MKSKFQGILITISLIAGCAMCSVAQPAWEVNPCAFEFSMTITGKITTDGTFSENVNDRVAAFVNGICRGVTHVSFESSSEEYFVYLMIYSNNPADILTFRIYDAGKNEVVNTKDSLNFAINKIVGSPDNPMIFSSDKLSDKAELIHFSIPDQVGETSFSGLNLYVQMSPNSPLTGLIPVFSMSEGAKVLVDGVMQASGKTANDFTRTVHYSVISADFSDTALYTVTVMSKSDKPPVFLSNPPGYVLQDEIYIYQVVASDNDADKITFNTEGLPQWLIFNPLTGIITGIPHNEEVGICTFFIRAGDGIMESVQTVIIQVINKNDPPEIKSVFGDQLFYVNRENEIQLPGDCIVDPDSGDALKFSLTTDNNSAVPAWLKFDPGNLKLTGNPPAEGTGTYRLKLTATDPGKLKEWIIFTLIVTNPTGINNAKSDNTFLVYPNPARDEINIRTPFGNEMVRISLTDISGKVLNTILTRMGSTIAFPMEKTAPGNYLIRLEQGKNCPTKLVRHLLVVD
jgi:hypothetical protein